VVLSTDRVLPEADQPVFVFRYVSLLEWENITKLDDEFGKATAANKMINLALQTLKISLCGWRNMKPPGGEEIPYDQKKLKSLLSPKELVELMRAAITQSPGTEDKKKLDSPSQCSSEKSAKTAKA
jgi:hypothetical protein